MVRKYWSKLSQVRIDTSTITNHFVPRHCSRKKLISCQLNKAGPFFTFEARALYSTSHKMTKRAPNKIRVSFSFVVLHGTMLVSFHWIDYPLGLGESKLFPFVTNGKDNSVISDMHLWINLSHFSHSPKSSKKRSKQHWSIR